MAFVYISPFPHLFNNRDYLFEHLQETSGYSLKEHQTIFLKRQNFNFSAAVGSISFVLSFRLYVLGYQDPQNVSSEPQANNFFYFVESFFSILKTFKVVLS